MISRAFGIGASILVARYIGPERFGEFGVVQGTAGMFQAFAGLGMGTTATKHIAELRERDKFAASRIVGLSIATAAAVGAVAAGGLIAAAPWIADRALAARALGPELRASAGLLLFGAVSGAFTGVLAGLEDFRTSARASVVGGLLGAPLIVAGAYFGGLRGAIWGSVGSACVQAIAAYAGMCAAGVRAGISADFRHAFRELRVLLHFSVPATLSTVLSMPALWLSSVIIVNQPGGYEEMGMYSAANQWRNAILFVPSMMTIVVLPMLSGAHGRGDRLEFRRVLRLNLLVTAVTAGLVAVPVALLSPHLMRAYGSGFDRGALALTLLCGSAWAAAVVAVAGQAIASRGQMWWGATLNAFWAVVLLCATYAMRDRGATGLAAANVVAYGIHMMSVAGFTWLMLRRTQRA